MIWTESSGFLPLRIQGRDSDQLRKTRDSKTRLKDLLTGLGLAITVHRQVVVAVLVPPVGRSHPGPCNWLSSRSLFRDLATVLYSTVLHVSHI